MMAMIDKIYGTYEQREELYNWCAVNKPDALVYFYDWCDEWDVLNDTDDNEYPLTNFPEEIDYWLLENCPLTWVLERIKEQYNIK